MAHQNTNKAFLVLVCGLSFLMCTFPVSAQPDLPNPPANFQTIVQGSLVIPMDNNNQNIGNAFNLKAYGLVHALLMNDIPVRWIIKSGKAKDAIDFSASAERLYPTFVAATTIDFRASAFVVDIAYINSAAVPWGLSATQVISNFGGNVVVYALMQNEVVDVRYTLDQRPKIAVFSNGGNQAIHQAILDEAGVTNYYIINAGAFTGISECFTFCSEPHWAGGPGDTVVTHIIRDFVQDGGNFLAQCRGVETYENLNFYKTDSGITILNATITNLYFNNDLAYMQFHGLLKENEGGSERNWIRGPNSPSWDPGFYRCVSGSNPDTIVASGAHLIPPDSVGGNVFYLGGHDYGSAYTDLLQIAAARMYLNASLIPSGRPTPFTVDVGVDTSVCQGDSIQLGGSPTAPGGTNYFWSPGGSLDDSTSANPMAFPSDTTVYILYANNGGCESFGAVTVNVRTFPTSTAGANQSVCSGNPTVSLNGFVTNATGGVWSGNGGTFSPDSLSLSTTYTLSASEVAAGSTQVVLSSSGMGSCAPATDTIEITVLPAISVDAGPDQAICFGSSNATLTALGTGGDSSYSYLWSTGDTVQSISVGVGTYTVTLADGSGCTPVLDTVVITTFTSSITVDAGPDTLLCVDFLPVGVSGSVTVASGGTWSGGGGTYSPNADSLNISYSPTPAEITAGTVTLTLTTTGNGTCLPSQDSMVITIADFAATLSLTASNVSCAGNMAYVIYSGGSPPFTVNWGTSPPQSGDTITNVPAGIYNVTVTDGNGCDSVLSFSITEPPILESIIDSIGNTSCFSGNNGTAGVAGIGGSPPYTYNWDASAGSQTTAVASGLIAGQYVVTITDLNGCTVSDTALITEPSELLSVISGAINISCNSGADGSATVSVTGGTAPYTYSWSDPGSQTDSTVTGLTAGTFIVSITDSNGCLGDTSITLTEPISALTLTHSSTDVTCNGGNDGTATVSVSGGTGPYTYLWNDPAAQTDTTATGLTTGTYNVTVTDNTGDCKVDTTIIVNEPVSVLGVTTTVTNVSCYAGNDGTATAAPSGGTSPYTYLWSDPTTQTTSTAIGLAVGTFSVTVIDNTGSCEIDTGIVITAPLLPLSLLTSGVNVSCNGGTDGQAWVATSGGTSPYTYLWDAAAGSQTDSLATGLQAGTYSVTVTDTNNCAVNDTLVIITEPTLLVVATSFTNISCKGGANGTATAIPSGGTPPYTFLWSDGQAQTGSTAFSLVAGSYSVTVTDSNNCTSVNNISLIEPTIDLTLGFSTIDVTCNGGSDGSATVTAQGGIPPYTYQWDLAANSQTTATATGLSAGLYSLFVTDSFGCIIADSSIEILEPPVLTFDSLNLYANDICLGDSLSVGATYDSPDPSFLFLWENGLGSGLGPFMVSPSNDTTFYVIVMDACGNQLRDSIEVLVHLPPLITMDSVIFSGCVPLEVTFENQTVSAEDSLYLWDFGNSQTSNLFNPPPLTYQVGGVYTISLIVFSTFGCTAVTTGQNYVIAYDLPQATCSADPNTTDTRNPTIEFTGGVDGLDSYTWDFGDTTYDNTQNTSHYYTSVNTFNVMLSVVDSNSCENTCTVEVIIEPYHDVVVPNAFTPNPNGSNGGVYDPFSYDNDVFFPATQYILEFHMMIFNRWGELVFETFDINIGWDGYYRGQLAQQDTYAWRIEVIYIDQVSIERLGDVTLIR